VNRRLSCDALRTRGWIVDEAEDGAQGLAEVARNRPDIILLDLLMPHMDGFEFLERLRAQDEGRSIPVVVITGKHLSEAERSRLTSRVYDVIIKSDHTTERLLEQIVSRVEIASDGETQQLTEVLLGADSSH
jgi:CheY-like chemotaxis protein